MSDLLEERDMFPVDRRAVREFLQGKLSKHLQTMTTADAYKYVEQLRAKAYEYRAGESGANFGEPIDPDVKAFIYETKEDPEGNSLFFSKFKYLNSLGHDLDEILQVLLEHVSKTHYRYAQDSAQQLAKLMVQEAYDKAHATLRRFN